MKKTRKELRREIALSVNGLKNSSCLMNILRICELYRKSMDEKEYLELSDLQWNQRAVINYILETENAKRTERICALIHGFRLGRTRKEKAS